MTNDRKYHLELAKRAKKDLRKLPHDARDRVGAVLRMFASGQPNLNVKIVTDKPPFLRLRTGDFRILLQPLTEPEMQRLRDRRGELDGERGYLVARIVDRADWERALSTLEICEID